MSENIPELTDKEMRKIALGMVEGNLFTSLHIQENDHNLLGQIFMPVFFGAFADYTPEQLGDIGFLWEDVSKAHKMAINGYPIFFSCHVVNKQDSLVIQEYYNILLEQRGQFLGDDS